MRLIEKERQLPKAKSFTVEKDFFWPTLVFGDESEGGMRYDP